MPALILRHPVAHNELDVFFFGQVRKPMAPVCHGPGGGCDSQGARRGSSSHDSKILQKVVSSQRLVKNELRILSLGVDMAGWLAFQI